jgi:hypothetical protein
MRSWDLDPTTNIYIFAVYTFIMVSCLVFILPFLELAATAAYRSSPIRPLPAAGHLRHYKPALTATVQASSLHRTASPFELRSRWSASELLLLTLYLLYNAAALLVPLYYYDVHDIYWEDDLPEGSPSLTTPVRWLYAVGAVAAWPCLGNMALAMFPTSRSSPLLAVLGGPGYLQLLWIHKLAGRVTFLWMAVHGEA